MGKSFICPINTVSEIDALASKLGGRVEELPTTHLGICLWELKVSPQQFRTGWWKNVPREAYKLVESIPFQGRQTNLVNSVLDTLPSYLMSIFQMPASVSKKVDVLRRNFVWQGNEDTKYHQVKWEEL